MDFHIFWTFTFCLQEFIANSDQTTAVTNVLPSPVVARYLRLYPTACNAYCSLRFDAIGCEGDLFSSGQKFVSTRLKYEQCYLITS